MNRLFRYLDPIFGIALLAALSMVLITAWPGTAAAANRVDGNGERATEQRTPGDFVAVRTNGVDVVVRQGAAEAVSVQADRNLLPLLETRIEDTADGKTLVVGWQRGAHVGTKARTLVTVTATRLSALAVMGSGDLIVEAFKATALAVRVEGSGDVKLSNLAADELSLAIKGSGDIAASGRAPRLAISIAGSGDIRTDGLKADEVSVGIAGSGDALINAERSLAVSIAGSGDVVYTGNAVVKKLIAGSGSVSRR